MIAIDNLKVSPAKVSCRAVHLEPIKWGSFCFSPFSRLLSLTAGFKSLRHQSLNIEVFRHHLHGYNPP